MDDNLKNIIVTVVFIVFLLTFFIINIIKSPNDISISERRKLNLLPNLTYDNIVDAKFMSDFEKYALDQFTVRDTFRSIKAIMLYDVFRQKDNNNIYVVDGHISKYYSSMNDVAIIDAGKKINKVKDNYLDNMNVYYSIIPDKNYYLANKYNYPHIDYTRLVSLISENVKDMTYIDLFDILTINDYYKTDIHWKQENLFNVVNKFADIMNFKDYVIDDYVKIIKEPFYGVYCGQSALPFKSEQIVYSTNEIIDSCIIRTLNEKTLKMEDTKVYVESNFNNVDPYDIYLGGAKSLITIENMNSIRNKELILFRDSFGSSIAPLLINAYSKITIIDLRYIGSSLLKDFVEFKDGQDVLFLYSTEVINNSSILKVF